MKTIQKLPVYLLALIYLIFGSNYFFHFITMPPMAGNAGTFAGVLFTTRFLLVVKVLELTLGLGMLVPKTRALALILIAPITVNILLFELLIAQQPGIGILMVILNGLAIYQLKDKYLGIVKDRLAIA
ncbi:MAG: DoxX protein [Bacteroidota bacterium]|nr:DoxX protein [Bacteroidota bacterium]